LACTHDLLNGAFHVIVDTGCSPLPLHAKRTLKV
jgi:hypothetical protein